MSYFPCVVQAVPGPDSTVYAYFSSGEIRLVDIKPLIARDGIFSPLSDDSFFRDRLTVMNDTVAWDVSGKRDPTSCIDLDPIEIYEKSQAVDDPLTSAA